MMRQYWLLGSVALAALIESAYGQTTTPAAHGAISGEIEEVRVTARRREESVQDIPIAVTAVTAQQLTDNQIYSVKDVAAFAPGLNINSDCVCRTFISMRGIGTTLIDTVQPGVGLFVDGIYQPNTSYLNSPLVDVERIEVLRGPQGTLFGNNTLGGAINVITRQPGDTLEGRVNVAGARPDDFQSISGTISGPIIPEVLQMRVGAAYHSQDGFQENILAGGDQNPLTQKTVNTTIRYKATDSAQFTFNGNYDRVKGGLGAYFHSEGPRDYTLDGSTNLVGLATFTYKGANLKGEFDVAPIKSKITATVAYNNRPSHGTSDADFSAIDFVRGTSRSKISTWTGELRFDTDWSDSISTLTGVYTDKSITHSSGTTTLVPFNLTTPVSDNASNQSAAIFGTLFAKLTPTLDLSVGVRGDYQKLRSQSAADTYSAKEVQPRVTLTKRLGDDLMAYGSIARGVRGGGANAPGAPNVIYKNDSVWTYELGSKFSALDHRLTVSTAVFYNDYRDFIGPNAIAPSTIAPSSFVFVNLNAGKMESYGWEGEATFRVTDQWTLSGGATLLQARIKNQDQFIETTGYALPGNRIAFVPDWNFSVGSNYVQPLGAQDSLVFNVGVVGKGARTGDSLTETSEPILEKYFLTNAFIAWQHDNLEVALFSTNLFDEKYIEIYYDKSLIEKTGLPAPFIANTSIQGERRRYGLRASVKF